MSLKGLEAGCLPDLPNIVRVPEPKSKQRYQSKVQPACKVGDLSKQNTSSIGELQKNVGQRALSNLKANAIAKNTS